MKAKDMTADGQVTANAATYRGMTGAGTTGGVATASSGTSLGGGPILGRVAFVANQGANTGALVEVPCPHGIFVDIGTIVGGVTVYYD